MKAKDLILICSHIDQEDFNRYSLVDKLVETLNLAKHLSLNLILVLGACGDEILSLGLDLENCELTFDPTYRGDFFTSVQVGLQAVSGAAFVLPITTENISESVLKDLDQAMWALRPAEKPEQQVDVLCHPALPSQSTAFPQLVTLAGARKIRELPENTSWGDPESLNVNMVAVETPNSSGASETGS